VATVKKTYSLDEKSAAMIDKYSKELGLSASAFVSLMVTQIDQVLRVSGYEEEKGDAGSTGDD
jgi:hypothetical protein